MWLNKACCCAVIKFPDHFTSQARFITIYGSFIASIDFQRRIWNQVIKHWIDKDFRDHQEILVHVQFVMHTLLKDLKQSRPQLESIYVKPFPPFFFIFGFSRFLRLFPSFLYLLNFSTASASNLISHQIFTSSYKYFLSLINVRITPLSSSNTLELVMTQTVLTNTERS